jgi:hypothetical protein
MQGRVHPPGPEGQASAVLLDPTRNRLHSKLPKRQRDDDEDDLWSFPSNAIGAASPHPGAQTRHQISAEFGTKALRT